jgi:hypothetical protein
LKNKLDIFQKTSGWAVSDVSKVTISGLNEVPEFIAGLNTKSLILKYSSANNEYAEITINQDFTNYDRVVFHIWSRNKKSNGWDYFESSDFVYQIEFDNNKYYVPTFSMFSDLTIDVSDISGVINTVKIRALHNSEDYLILSHMVLSTDEIPRDIFESVQEQIAYDLEQTEYARISGGEADGIKLGTIASIASGDESIILETLNTWLDKYAFIKIKDTNNDETHQIDHNDEVEYFFTDAEDGHTIQNTYSNADIFLIIPVHFNPNEKDIRLPGMAVWGLTPEPIKRQTKEEEIPDTFNATDGSLRKRLDDQINLYEILIDCEARQIELLNFMKKVAMIMIGREYIWVNGYKIGVDFQGSPTYIEPVQSYNQIPKIQYVMLLEIKEQIAQRRTLPATTNITKNYQLSSTLLNQ